MAVALLFPPVVDPRGPHLALPSLAAHLRSHGVDVALLDLNAAGMRYLLRTPMLRKSARGLRDATGAVTDPSSARGRLALYADTIVASMGDALGTFSDPERFFDARAFNDARELVASGLTLSAAARHPGLRFDVMPPRYDVEGCDPQQLEELVRVARREDLNVFIEHWRDEVFPELVRLEPELVGVTITNRQQIIPGLMLARELRGRGFFTVIGGTVFTKFAGELGALPEFFRAFADAVVVYEGETALLALLEALRTSRDLSKVPNLLYLERDRVRATPIHVEDINALATPDFEGLDLDAYLSPYPVLPILTGKGCYFNRCKFCDIPYINHVSRKAYRVRHVEKIAADIEALADRFACRHFVITDEALSPRLLHKLADALDGSTHRDLSFTGYARLEAGFTPEVCAALRRMGMKKLYFGLESASQQTLDHMDKGTRAEVAPVVLRNCAEAGVSFHVFSIIGFPQEHEDSTRETFEFFVRNTAIIDRPGNTLDIHPFGLELRTDYFEERDRFGITVEPGALEKDFVIGIDRNHWSDPSGIDRAALDHLLNVEFYPRLRETYRRFQATADGIWPGFEEYAALYGDHYAERQFPYYTCIPEIAEDELLELTWSASLAVMKHGDKVLLLKRQRFLILDRETYDALDGARLTGVDDVFSRTLPDRAADPARAKAYLDRLISLGYLHVRVRGGEHAHARPGRACRPRAHRT